MNKRPSLDSDSLTSFFVPWQKNRAPPIYPNAQTGRVVPFNEFCLFYVAVTLLILSLALSAISAWSLFFRSDYTLLINPSTELAYFALPVAVLCLPCSWIALSVHNDSKSYKFLSLVLILLTFSTVLMVIGVYIGFTHKLHLNLSQIESSRVLEEFRESMRQSMKSYGKNAKIWEQIQGKLGCCGVDNYTDWLPVIDRVPKSCCCNGQVTCDGNSTSSTGCLKIITASLALQTCLFSGINCVALFLQCSAIVMIAAIYFCGKRQEED